MAGPRQARRGGAAEDYWPGFVDALATLLLVVVFLLSLFIAAQFTLGQALSNRDAELARLNTRLSDLADMLALEKDQRKSVEERMTLLLATLAQKNTELDTLKASLETTKSASSDIQSALDAEREISQKARDEIAVLAAQIEALNVQLTQLNAALEAAEKKDAEQKTQIVNLGKRLNAALAQKVSELARYKSEFFGRLLEVLGDREGIRVVGDRFVFETDILFASGSAELNPAGEQSLAQIAAAIIDVSDEIPADIDWVIRVDGHTDTIPIRTGYASNWELSAARAISVVKFFIRAGVPPKRLVAAGFGQYHPIDKGHSAAALARNRRIELKMDSR
jgi:chemotaxis protein MotB